MDTDNPNPPSAFFNDSVRTTSHIVTECGFCGRTFFENDEAAGTWNSGELEALRERARLEPDKCIPMDHVACGRIAGKEGVIGCPCNWGEPYEKFIWNHRSIIMSYIQARVKKTVEQALEDEGFADQAMSDIEREEKARRTVRCPVCRKFVSEIAMTEGDMCLKCWEKAEKEAEEQRLKELERKVFANTSVNSDDDNLPF